MKPIVLLAIFTVAVMFTPTFAKPIFSQPRNEPISAVPYHGSIGVVISTKDGFVLAADSRLTSEDGKRDNGQKLYTIGNSVACVIAGTVEAEVHSGTAPYQFEVRDAVGSHLLRLDEVARQGGHIRAAKDVIPMIEFGVSGILGLAKGDSRIQPGPFVEASCASIAPDNSREWIKSDFPVVEDVTPSGRTLKVRTVYGPHTDTSSFCFDVIGQGLVANTLLSASHVTEESQTRTPIMQRFYELKRLDRLNGFTLNDAVSLARDLVQATIDLSDESFGVGGPIDIATVTQSGVHWIQRKCEPERLPRPHSRIYDSTLSLQTLDNIECVRCDFTDARLFYAGNADVQLVDAKLGGSCRLAIAPNADKQRPQVVAKLRRLMQGQCRVVVQAGNFP